MESFVNQVLDGTNHFYRVALNQFDWWKKIQGTKCIITRLSVDDEYAEVFGSIASSTLMDDSNLIKIPYVILINLNDMLKLYQKSTNQLNFYDNKSEIKLGDVLVFSRNGLEFKWKVTNIDSFSEADGLLYNITIQGLTEVDSTDRTIPY